VADKDVKVTEVPAEDAVAPAEAVPDAQPTADDARPDEDKPTGDNPTGDKPTGDKPAEDKPAEDKPAEDKPAEDKPAEDKPAEDKPAGDAQPAEDARAGRRSWRIAAALGAVTVVLTGFGVWATLHASNLRSNAAAQANTALTDGPATAAVRREISAAVNTIFSYNYADTAATRRAAQRVLTGPAVRQYNTLFALVTKNAPAQKLVVTTKVSSSGVELLNGNRARLLVFANQQDTRAGTGQTSYAGAMFAVTALRQGGRWKIENIDTFGG
jgi:Mce-associated membrane protein